jgi:hypothetical protein
MKNTTRTTALHSLAALVALSLAFVAWSASRPPTPEERLLMALGKAAEQRAELATREAMEGCRSAVADLAGTDAAFVRSGKVTLYDHPPVFVVRFTVGRAGKLAECEGRRGNADAPLDVRWVSR